MKKVVVYDKMQQGYEYFLQEEEGKNFDPEFTPDLSPQEMLELGIFGGVYMRDCREEFPKVWFEKAKLQKYDLHHPDKTLNYFGVLASQPLTEWKRKGWIYKEDPRGWFQWYCRYYMGRRLAVEDKRQIKRWKAMRRHVAQIYHNCRRGDVFCRPRQRQALLQWGYDVRKL